MRKFVTIIILLTSINKLFSEEYNDQNDFQPIPIESQEIVDLLPKGIERTQGIIGSGTITLIGMTIATYATYSVLDSDFSDPNNGEIQKKILLASSGYILVAIGSWFLHYFIFLK